MTLDRETLSANTVIMEPLYEQLLEQNFTSSTDAIEFCRDVCQEYGFSIQQETNANRSIYVRCSHISQTEQQTPPLRKRSSPLKDAASANPTASSLECTWRIVLNENETTSGWSFRKSLNSQASQHNHLLMTGNQPIWPQEVYDRIIQLARQKNMQTDEIRDTIKLQFPDITWNDRRFLNYLTEERGRMRQKNVTDKVQRLVMASTRLCSVAAANEDWAACVEGELVKMLENYKHLARIPNQQIVDSMVDLQLDMIHSEIDKNRRPTSKHHQDADMFSKKRRTNSSVIAAAAAAAGLPNESVQVMSIPSCTLYIRSQPLKSLSEPSSQSRRAFTDLIAASSAAAISQHHHYQQQPQQHYHHQQQQQQQHHHHHQHHQQIPFGMSSVFTLTSPVSSPSSTSSLQQRVDYGNYRNNNNNDMLQSPPIPDSTNMMMPSGYSGGNDAYTPHPPTPSSNYNGSATAAAAAAAAAAAVAAATGGDINFNFDTNTALSYSHQHVPPSPAPLMIHRHHQQKQPNTDRMAGYPTSMGYYSTSSPSIGRESSPSTSIQQRIMLQQEYEQHQRHLQHMESSSVAAVAATNNVHLPLIRSDPSLSGHIVQHRQHHPVSNLNPNHPQQNWP